jgi:hypothetical protein
MKRVIGEYRKFFEIPDDTKDSIVITRIITFIVLLFILGFLIGKNFIG